MTEARTVAILGAGPVGLAAAAQVLERGMEPIVLEAGPEAGHAVRQWAHVPLFSPWEYCIDKASGRLLAEVGWNAPPSGDYPTGGELLAHYIEPLATRTRLKDHIRLSSRVTAVARKGFDKMKSAGRAFEAFTIRYQNGKGPESLKADAVIDASGTWFSPNPAGADGLPAIGEEELRGRIAYGMPDVLGAARSRYAGKTVAVLGAGHSAVGTLIDLARLAEQAPGTRVIWLMRGEDPRKAFGGGANDKLVARGALGQALAALVASGRIAVETGFKVSHLSQEGTQIRVATGKASCCRAITVDALVVATGLRPDFGFLREVRLALDPAVECPPALAPLIDPNIHSCGTVRPHGARELAHPEPGFYVAGIKSYGRAPTFLMLTGYEQARSIVADIAGDREAAERVELVLPETGVCSGPGPVAGLGGSIDAAAGCCGGPPPTAAGAVVSGCCVADVRAKEEGKAGCGA
ncbi:NAD(P)-binding domain-containing protein [Vineibacter terrae]|uniref:NAD(P)-binding domain-containing protein n=1 Tax=Vineibacter terrae TaxID=2586908 RepID=UPI002E3348D2|nr:NAD(P)-binding domain-containing protein [Vineibacter terrae]HEX2886102.1 NAD(P)-binding domain-containing protein [Vineibacter terrae]